MHDEDRQKNYELAEKLIAEQNFAAALVAGAVASLLAAAAYGITVSLWPFSHGFVAAAIGIVVGLSIQFLGRGIALKFAIAATVYTVAGCALGNLLHVVVNLARNYAMSPLDVLRNHSVSVLAEQAASRVSMLDFVYWFVAVFCAAFLAKRPLSRSQRLAIGLIDLRA